MIRNYLVGPHGDAASAVLAAAGYNFNLLLLWLSLLRAWLATLLRGNLPASNRLQVN